MNRSHVIKEPSPSQAEELKEGRKIAKAVLATAIFMFISSLIVCFGGLRLIKVIVGVESFGLEGWSLIGVRAGLFVAGTCGCVLLGMFAIALSAVIARIFKVT